VSSGKQEIKQLTVEVSGPMIKETDEMMLVDNGDDTATWYETALCAGIVKNPRTGAVTFICTRNAAVRNVRLK
jgi:hypothetical protein